MSLKNCGLDGLSGIYQRKGGALLILKYSVLGCIFNASNVPFLPRIFQWVRVNAFRMC